MDIATLLLGLFLGSPTAGAAAAPTPAVTTRDASADALVDKVQTFYRSTQQLTAKFRQKVHNKTFGKETVSDGKVYIKKPGKMRWDYMSKARKTEVDRTFISDGSVVWVVMISGKSYYRRDVKEDLLPVAITFLSGKGDLKSDFTARLDTSGKRGAPGDQILELTPKKPSAQYKKLWLVVDPKDSRVKSSVILNSNDDESTFEFYEPDTRTALRDQIFVFNEAENKKKGFRLVSPPSAQVQPAGADTP